MADGSTFPRKAFVLRSAKDGFVAEMLSLQAEQDAGEAALGYSSRGWTARDYDGLGDSLERANLHRLKTEG